MRKPFNTLPFYESFETFKKVIRPLKEEIKSEPFKNVLTQKEKEQFETFLKSQGDLDMDNVD